MFPDTAKLIYKCKGADKVCIVSDCLRAEDLKMMEAYIIWAIRGRRTADNYL